MTCKDCLHYDLCREIAYIKAEITGKIKEQFIYIGNNVTCKFFKDKSKFIELPCKVGKTVHYITFWNNKYDYHFITNVSYDILYQLLHEKEIGYVVFMTGDKSKAEARLKELNQ